MLGVSFSLARHRYTTFGTPYSPHGEEPPFGTHTNSSGFEILSSESPPVGWSLSTRTIRSYLGGGPDSSRRAGNPQHAR